MLLNAEIRPRASKRPMMSEGMASSEEMLDVRQNRYQSAIEALNDCIQACNSCLTDDLLEKD